VNEIEDDDERNAAELAGMTVERYRALPRIEPDEIEQVEVEAREIWFEEQMELGAAEAEEGQK
jgi:hypothetical protein